MDYDDYPSGEPDTKTEECPECNGEGYTVEAECCRQQSFIEQGNCCGIPVPVQVPCEYCKGTGCIEISLDEYKQSRLNDEADFKTRRLTLLLISLFKHFKTLRNKY